MSTGINDFFSFHLEPVVTKANISFSLTGYVNNILESDFTLPKSIVKVLSFFLYKVAEIFEQINGFSPVWVISCIFK